ncbi:hypothetical protein V6Z11_A09G028300 [Gossypium hirsutum]
MDSSICLPKWSRVHNKIFDNGGIRSIFLASPFKKDQTMPIQEILSVITKASNLSLDLRIILVVRTRMRSSVMLSE